MGSRRVALIIGASRGIGRQIAIDFAREGYAVVVAAKSISDATSIDPFPPDPNSNQSTISTVAREITDAGGEATAIPVDVRDFQSLQSLLDKTVKKYLQLDVLVYNSGAIWWASVENTPMKRFKLLQSVNPEGLYGAVQAALPFFEKNDWCGRIIVVSPPIYSRFFRGKTAYAMGKVGMSVLTKGLAMDFEREGKIRMAITSIWPAVSIESAATQQFRLRDASSVKDLRKASIFSDAILAMVNSEPSLVNGLLELDEDFLRKYVGMKDFSKYSVVEGATPRRIMPASFPDLRVAEQNDEGCRVDSTTLRASKI